MEKQVMKAEGASLAIYPDGPNWDGEPTATIGDVAFKTPEAGAALLSEALGGIRAAGRDRVLAPMAGDTWHSYRFVTESDGSAPFLLEPSSRAHERAVFEAAGFASVARYFSARLLLEKAATAPPPETDAFTVTTWDGTDPEGLFREVYAVSETAFAGNAFYKPISEEAFLAIYLPLVPVMKAEFIFFARRPDGTLAGFLFAIPNYAEGAKPKTVILKTYASLVRGAGRHLIYACNMSARAQGCDAVIHALIHDANASARRSAVEGGEVFRRYELLGLRSDG